MRLFAGVAAAIGLMACGNAVASIDGVVTSSTATVTFKPDSTGQNIVYNYSGDQIGGDVGDNAFGSGANFASSSLLQPNRIAFENGNASSGEYAYTVSQTDVAITFTNDSANPVVPLLRSEIIPAGFGVYVGNLCLSSLTNCPQSQALDFQSFSPDSANDPLAGATIDFKILNGGVALYDLTASIELVYDPVSHQNVFVDNFSQAASMLNGFGLETTPGSPTAYGFNWQATDINVPFPSGSPLLPGQSGTLTYQTTVSSFSRAPCGQASNAFVQGCLLAYSAFGDPIGGSPGIKPGAQASAFGLGGSPGGTIDNLSYGTFEFGLPTFEDGVLTYILAPAPEPDAWLLAFLGAGAVGAVLRRRRAELAAAEATLFAS